MKRILRVEYKLAAAIAFLTFLVYLPALRNEFLGWDDGSYIVENVHIRSLNWALLKWAFFDFYASNWHPLTWLSHALDYAVWGLNPMGHHLTNNILHAVNTFLVVLLVVRLIEESKQYAVSSEQKQKDNKEYEVSGKKTSANRESSPASGRFAVDESSSSGKSGTLPKDYRKRPDFPSHVSHLTPDASRSTLIVAGVTGLLFGLHPIHVESVAWVAERKDLLCALFYLLSVMAYIKYATRRQAQGDNNVMVSRSNHLSLLFFILALMSKPMAVSLPVVLLILDWYPFNRITSLKTFMSSLAEKIPFIALSIGSAILTLLAQKEAMVLMEFVPLQIRVLVAVRAVFIYLGKMLLPLELSPFYPYPKKVYLLSPEYSVAIMLLIGLTAACLIIARRRKAWLSFWAYYVATLLPVLGIVQVGRQAMADRYAYLPSLAPFLAAGLLVALVYRKLDESKRRKPAFALIGAFSVLYLVITLSFLTFRQIGVWNNTIGFWSYVIQQNPGISMAYYGRGLALFASGQTEKAMEDYDRAIALDPFYAKAYATRGFVHDRLGQVDKAIADYDKAIALNPRDAQAFNNRGVIFEKMGRFDKAIEDYNKVIEIDPNESQSYNNRGVVYEKMGRFDRALADYDRAIALNQSNSDAYYNRGNAYDEMGRFDEAISDYDKAIALNPNDSQAYNNRGLVFEKMNDLDKAIADYNKAVALNPSNSEAQSNRLRVLERKAATPSR
jgi:tetratricopeptide (TPR) repeat protein